MLHDSIYKTVTKRQNCSDRKQIISFQEWAVRGDCDYKVVVQGKFWG